MLVPVKRNAHRSTLEICDIFCFWSVVSSSSDALGCGMHRQFIQFPNLPSPDKTLALIHRCVETAKSSGVRSMSSLGAWSDLLAHKVWQDWHETFCFWHWLLQEKDLQNVTIAIWALHDINTALSINTYPFQRQCCLFRTLGGFQNLLSLGVLDMKMQSFASHWFAQQWFFGKWCCLVVATTKQLGSTLFAMANCEALFRGWMDTPKKGYVYLTAKSAQCWVPVRWCDGCKEAKITECLLLIWIFDAGKISFHSSEAASECWKENFCP